MTRTQLTRLQIQQIYAATRAGEPYASIAARFGCSKSNIQHHAHQALRVDGKPAPPKRKPPVVIHKCLGCPLLFMAPKRGRVYHSDQCREEHNQRKFDADRRYFLAELDWIAGTDTWANIAHRLGYLHVRSLERVLSRMGEHEWARRVHEQSLDSVRWGRAA